MIKFLNNEGAELKEFFKPEFAQNLTVGEMQQKKLTIDSFTSGAVGKYIALYGIEDIFENLPLDITDIQLNNRDNNDIIINIPASIGKYKKLKQLLLTNCVDRIPDEVCELKDLRFIGLVDNPKLTQVPSCIVNLDKLIFLNLKGSKNVVVPDEIKQRATLFGDEMWDFGTN